MHLQTADIFYTEIFLARASVVLSLAFFKFRKS